MATEDLKETIEIEAEPNRAPSRLAFKVRLTGSDGKPLAGREVTLSLDGDGGFVMHFSSKEIKRETDAAGEAKFLWFSRGIVGRRVKATIRGVPTDGDGTVTLEPTEDEQGVITGWQREWLKLPGKLAR